MHETSLDVSDFAALVGKDLPQPEQFNYGVTRDRIRHFAYCIPDSNALYLDHEYAATTRWRGIIAPPGYLYAHGSPAWLGKMPGIRDSSGNELEGDDNATEAWEFFRPVRPGDTVLSHGKIAGIEPKKSRKLGDAVLVNEEMRFTNQKEEIVARLNSYTFRFDARRVADAGTIAQKLSAARAGPVHAKYSDAAGPARYVSHARSPLRRSAIFRRHRRGRRGSAVGTWAVDGF